MKRVIENFLADPIARVRHAWTKNDGKPREGWASGRDLKEMVLIGALVICTALMAPLVVMQIVG